VAWVSTLRAREKDQGGKRSRPGGERLLRGEGGFGHALLAEQSLGALKGGLKQQDRDDSPEHG
jgi:hypothetical protein